MHNWGDKDSQGRDICYRVGEVSDYIADFIVKWGRIQVTQNKEKFGTVRVYCNIGWSCFHSIVYPYHNWIHQHWYYRLDLNVSEYTMPVLNWVFHPLQTFVYRLAYKKAIKKWPDLREEILDCADYPGYLRGL